LKNDREIVLTAVQRNGNALRHASDELKKDREIVLAAVQENGSALCYASDELKKDQKLQEIEFWFKVEIEEHARFLDDRDERFGFDGYYL